MTIPLTLGLAGGFSVGEDPGSPVTDDYKPPFAFTGKIYTVTIDVGGHLIKDSESDMRMAMAHQ